MDTVPCSTGNCTATLTSARYRATLEIVEVRADDVSVEHGVSKTVLLHTQQVNQ